MSFVGAVMFRNMVNKAIVKACLTRFMALLQSKFVELASNHANYMM
ncbi:MAG: hypothetical protein AB8U44_01760 [Aaplasma endosymbiont of Hyalomma asiaticum]